MYSFNDFSLSSDITYLAILEPMVSGGRSTGLWSLNWCCYWVVVVSVLPSEKVIVLMHPIKIAPVIIARIYNKDENDRIDFDFS
jgi:hypothetical protein